MGTKHPDAKIIADLGGPAKVAELLCLDKQGGVQRVQNWIARGIPDAMKVKHPMLFMPRHWSERLNVTNTPIQKA